MRLVPDASATAEVLLRTPRGQAAEVFLLRAELFAPELLDIEVAAVLRKAVLGRRLPVGRAQKALAFLRDLPVTRFSHRELAIPAFALRNNLTVYDAAYVIVARAADAVLLTADGPLARAPRLGVPVHNILS